MGKIEVYFDSGERKMGIGVKLLHKKASLADLLDAWQPLCDAEKIYKLYGNTGYSACKGCVRNCCNTAYVIPDIIAFKRMAEYLNCDHRELVKEYFHQEKVDIGLLRIKPEPCIFLKDNICSIYPVRSLICRFYLCSEMLSETEQLIYSITFTGITALQLFAEDKGLINIKQKGFSSFDQLFYGLIREYRHNRNVELFLNADDYSEIPLLPFM